MKKIVAMAVMIVATIMLIGFCITSCKGDDEPQEHSEQAQENELQFHPIFVPQPNGGVQMIPMWY